MTRNTATPRRTGRASAQGSEDLSREIQEKAFELYQARGGAHGDDQADWFEAERIVRQGRERERPRVSTARPAATRGNGGAGRPTTRRRKTGRTAEV